LALTFAFALQFSTGPRPLRAETLFDAFAAAYASNPTLGAQRAAVRVGLQDKAIAETGYAPNILATADYGYHNTRGRDPGSATSDVTAHPRGTGVSLTQNIWNGFRTLNSVAREDASLQGARDQLCAVEQQVMIEVATAYADVLRDKTIVEFHRGDVDLLAARARETRLRASIGDLTLTDVDQSEASLARSRADLTIAMTNLEASMAAYRAVVGRDPGRLEPAAAPERLLPRDLGLALSIAQAEHPAIRAALAAVAAAEHNIDVEKGGYAPSLDLTASSQRRWDPDYYPNKTELTDTSVVGRLSFPIFDRGLTTASVHRATEVASQQMMELDHRRAQIRADLVETFGRFGASRSVIASADAQIAANDRALFGVELEATAGQRTTLDILTAERSLLDSRVAREVAQHDRIVAGYRLLAAIGRLSLDRLTREDTRGREVPAPPTKRTKLQGRASALGAIATMPFRQGL
jgi:outer membrane protein